MWTLSYVQVKRSFSLSFSLLGSWTSGGLQVRLFCQLLDLVLPLALTEKDIQ